MRSEIHLIRHGITEANQKRLFYGAADIPLAEEGVDELNKLVEKRIYPQLTAADYYTTGLIRTEQTFALIFGKQEYNRIEDLQEMRFGDFEMKSHEELKELEEYQTWIADKSGTLASPKGESIKGFHDRIKRGFKTLMDRHRAKSKLEAENKSAIVCHGGTIASIMETCFPGGKEHFYKWLPDPGHGYTLILEDGEIVDYEEI